MKVKRIVSNITAADPAAAKRFYEDVLGLDVLMDQGWIATYGSRQQMSVQISVASEGGSGTPVPEISIDIDDVPSFSLYGPAAVSLVSTIRNVCLALRNIKSGRLRDSGS